MGSAENRRERRQVDRIFIKIAHLPLGNRMTVVAIQLANDKVAVRDDLVRRMDVFAARRIRFIEMGDHLKLELAIAIVTS